MDHMYPVQETPTRERLIKMLAEVATADGDASDDAAYLMNLFTPAPNRTAAGKEFEHVMGYNPLTFYDINDILSELDRVFTRLGASAQTTIQTSKKEIAERALAIYETNRPDNLKEALSQALSEFIDEEEADKAAVYLTGVAPRKYEPEGAIDDEEDDPDDEIDVGDLDDGGTLDLSDFGTPDDDEDDFDISTEEEDDD